MSDHIRPASFGTVPGKLVVTSKGVVEFIEHARPSIEWLDVSDNPEDGQACHFTVTGGETYVGETLVDAVTLAVKAALE